MQCAGALHSYKCIFLLKYFTFIPSARSCFFYTVIRLTAIHYLLLGMKGGREA
jgi:hypothetical protein